MSTKTWQEELRDVKDPSGQYFISYLGQNEIKALEQFISELRKQDEYALIKMLNRQAFPHIELIIQLIKDYYENN